MPNNQGNQKKKEIRRCEITDRDYKFFRYLWKWKALSTMAIAHKFFPEIKPLSAYRRLMYLEAGDYIQSVEIDKRWQEVWTLTDRGFKYILPKLGELQVKGHKSENIYHDHLVTAFHLGEWLTHQPDNSQNYSEQQLRRYPMDAWPDWVPRSPNHRPDGYSILTHENKKVLIAFEIELWVKARDRYETVVAYYDSQEAIEFVFWLIDSKTTLNALKKSFEKYNVHKWGKHHFLLLSDFLKLGWMAPFIEGQYCGKSPGDFIHQMHVRPSSVEHQCPDVQLLLDIQKYPIKSNKTANPPAPQKT